MFCWIIILINLIYFIIQYFLKRKYSPFILQKRKQYKFPKVTVLVPAYNEGQNVQKTLISILNSDYPKRLLEVIAINDGSKDDTLEYIKKVKQVKLINVQKNRGKRNALLQGFHHASGKIIITVDSDTIIQSNTITNMVIPFLLDKEISACAGNILVKNTENNIFGMMLDSAFKFGFNFIRPAQSVINGVLCTPGALSAYRKSQFSDKELVNWRKQKFLNKRANIGQDRALTNIVLQHGKKVVYQSSAVAYTNVPKTYSQLCKMFMRWIRGDIRENFCILKFLFRNQNIYTILNIFMQFIWLLLPFIVLPMIIIYMYTLFPEFLIVMIISTIFWSILPFIFSKNWHSFTFGFLNLVTMIWLIPWCWITIYKSKWGTR